MKGTGRLTTLVVNPERYELGHVSDTTPNDSTAPIADDWQSRYTGLQRVLAKRDADLTARDEELGKLREEQEKALTELAEHRQKVIDANEDESARATYEALKDRFEPPPPPTLGTNPVAPRPWYDANGREPAQKRETSDRSTGFPT